jgi:plasmid rolling circle replication initiator protein Rep
MVYNENQSLIDLKDYEKYKRLSLSVADLMKKTSILYDRGFLIENCGNTLQFDKQGDLVSADFCRQRLCPNCQRRNSLKMYSKFKVVESDLAKQGYKFIHLVLTIKNCDESDLSDTVTKLYKSSSKFFADKRIKQGFKGALRCLEVSYNKMDCNFHPHLHCLVAVKKSYFTSRYYLNRDKIAEIWKKHLKIDYIPQVWLTKCDDNAVCEVVKYAVKPLELSMSEIVQQKVLVALHSALHCRRLVQTYGIVKESAKINNVDFDADDLEKIDASEVTTVTFNHFTKKYEFTFFGK